MPCAHLTDGPLVVAVDSSTQSTKAIIVDGAGNVLSMAAIEAHAPHTPTGPDVATSAKPMAQFGQTIEPNQHKPRPITHQPKRLKTFQRRKKYTPSPSSAPAPWAAP